MDNKKLEIYNQELKEIYKLAKKKLPKEFWEDGLYNSEEFKNFLQESTNIINKELENNEKYKDKANVYRLHRIKELIKEKYNIDYKSPTEFAPMFLFKLAFIEKKYGFEAPIIYKLGI